MYLTARSFAFVIPTVIAYSFCGSIFKRHICRLHNTGKRKPALIHQKKALPRSTGQSLVYSRIPECSASPQELNSGAGAEPCGARSYHCQGVLFGTHTARGLYSYFGPYCSAHKGHIPNDGSA